MKFKPRLRRLDWLYTHCPIYYLTLCTQNRKRSLANAANSSGIHEILRAGNRPSRFGRILYDHARPHPSFRGLLAANRPPLWKWIKALRGDLSKILREDEGEGTHWEKDFFDHVMRSEESYWRENEYVRQNPVRAGLVKRPEDWPYQGRDSSPCFRQIVAAVSDRRASIGDRRYNPRRSEIDATIWRGKPALPGARHLYDPIALGPGRTLFGPTPCAMGI